MARPLAPCGTYSAYQRHRKRGEAVDSDCEQAHQDYLAALRGPDAKPRRPKLSLVPPPPPEPPKPQPSVRCPYCKELEIVDHPADSVARRMAIVRHLTKRPICKKKHLVAARHLAGV